MIFAFCTVQSQSSFSEAVNAMWKLCKAQAKSEKWKSCCRVSARFGTDFSHEGLVPKVVTIGQLLKFSTSPPRLLLLLVL